MENLSPSAFSPSAATNKSSTSFSLTSVEIDAMVALKIEKHGREKYPGSISGTLLGFEMSPGILHVSNCFRHLQKSNNKDNKGGNSAAADDADDASNEAHQVAMMGYMQSLNSDCMVVGLYQSSSNSNFLNLNWIENILEFQKTISQSVLIEHDSFDTLTGSFTLRAYRLTDSFSRLLSTKSVNNISSEIIEKAGLLAHGLIIELPVYIRNTSIVNAFTHAQNLSRVVGSNVMRRDAHVERKLLAVIDTLYTYDSDQMRFLNWQRNYVREKSKLDLLMQRRQAETMQSGVQTQEQIEEFEAERIALLNRLPPEPSKVQSLLLSNQVSHHIRQMATSLLPSTVNVEMSRAFAAGTTQ